MANLRRRCLAHRDTRPRLTLSYEVDDFTDPWTTPQTVVFLHGIAESAQAWRAWVPHFARRYRVIRIDQRGFGASTPMPSDYPWTIAGLADDLARFARAIGLDRFHLVSAKLGGTIAMKFAADFPQMLLSLSLVGTPPSPAASLGKVIPEWNVHIRQIGGRSWAQWTMGNRLGLGDAAGRRGLVERADGRDRVVDADRRHRGDPYVRCHGRPAAHPVRPHAGRVTTTGSGLGSVEQVRAWQQRIPDSSLTVIERDSYHVAASDPDLAAPPVLAFVSRP